MLCFCITPLSIRQSVFLAGIVFDVGRWHNKIAVQCGHEIVLPEIRAVFQPQFCHDFHGGHFPIPHGLYELVYVLVLGMGSGSGKLLQGFFKGFKHKFDKFG